MRVLQVINSLHTGGAEKLLLETIPIYQREGITMDLLLLNGEETKFKESFKSLSKGNIFSLKANKKIYDLFLVFKTIPYLKNYDLIHIHLFPALYWVVFAKLISFSRVKMVFTEHNTSNRRRNLLLFKFFDRIIYSYLDKIITISDSVDLNIKNHLNFNNNKFRLINNGVSISSFYKAEPYLKSVFFNETDFILIQVSSFTEQKNQEILIRSLLELPKEIKLLLVGEGDLKGKNIQLVGELGLNDRVKFLGIRMDVPRLLKTSDIIVLSSNYEGLSLSSIEGMASGKPFIASDVPGLTEIVKGAGLLFENNNFEDLANKILKLIEDKTYYELIVEKCLMRASEYDVSLMVNKHLKLYNSLLEN